MGADPFHGSQFFRLIPDMVTCQPWHLTAPRSPDREELDSRIFTRGLPITDLRVPLSIGVRNPGTPVQLSFGSFDYLVVEHRLAVLVQALAPSDIELFPATVDGSPSYEVMNVKTRIPCIDEDRTVGEKWGAADGRPDKIGQFRTVSNLVIDASKVTGSAMFRVAGWEVALVVSDQVRQLLVGEAGPGLRFLSVSE